MKCVRFKKTGEVGRVPDLAAAYMVEGGKAEYVPRHVWKSEVRDAEVAAAA